jgi:hypothetical protein
VEFSAVKLREVNPILDSLPSFMPPKTQRERESSRSVGLSTLLKKSTSVPRSIEKLRADSRIVRSISLQYVNRFIRESFQGVVMYELQRISLDGGEA